MNYEKMNFADLDKSSFIKCPVCGSTAQVRAGDPYIVEGGAYFEQKVICGCGSRFCVSFPRVPCGYYDVIEGE